MVSGVDPQVVINFNQVLAELTGANPSSGSSAAAPSLSSRVQAAADGAQIANSTGSEGGLGSRAVVVQPGGANEKTPLLKKDDLEDQELSCCQKVINAVCCCFPSLTSKVEG